MSSTDEISRSDVLDLLSEVSKCFTREDDLPDGLLPRIDAALAAANAVLPTNIDPRWADIDFDKVNAELRDLRAQVGRLQDFINRFQPVQAGADGYVQPDQQGEASGFTLAQLANAISKRDLPQEVVAEIAAQMADILLADPITEKQLHKLLAGPLSTQPAQGGPNA